MIDLLLTFLIVFLVLQLALPYLFPDRFGGEPQERAGIELNAKSEKVRFGHHPVVVIENHTESDLMLPDRCPQPPLDVAIVRSPESPGEEVIDLMANETALPCPTFPAVPAHSSMEIDLGPWKYSLFSELGTYQVSLPIETEDGDISPSARIRIVEVGAVTKLFRTLVTRPILNGLIFIASFMPGHNLGASIILLTILIKLILLLPNQHALEGQKKLNELQPKLDAIKKKYPNDQRKQQEETMALWKKEKINPLQSCLPMLIQFPILIGLFFVIRDGGVLELSRHLIYPVYDHLTWGFGTRFLGLELTERSLFIMPPLLVVLQFIQMKMTFNRKKKDVVDVGTKSRLPELNQQTMMLYGLPIMIGVFAFQFQAAVSLYWAISTVFGIAQQWFVNRKK